MKRLIYLLLMACFTVLFSACQSSSTLPISRSDNAALVMAEQAEQLGDYRAAAEQYLALARTANKQQQALFYLAAAEAFELAGDGANSMDSLDQVDRAWLNSSQQYDATLLKAKIHLAKQQADQALAALAAYDEVSGLSDLEKRNLFELKISAYAITENWLAKTNHHLLLAPLLAPEKRQHNQQLLWQALMNLEPRALDLFNPGNPPAIDSGWFTLAYAVKAYRNQPAALATAIAEWQRDYPNHPASAEFYQATTITSPVAELPQAITTIAVLLPESGSYQAVAKAIKEGIIAAHLTTQADLHLQFFTVDTDKQAASSNIVEQYQRAIAQQASLVIGPLDKLALKLLAQSDALTVPVLALNTLPNQVTKANLFQFGLSPEEDAITAANFASAQGFARAIMLAPASNWGNRMTAAFSEQWQANGGVLLQQTLYDIEQHDFSASLQPLLGLTASKQRATSLRRVLGQSLQSEPRRRQDIDFIFLTASPQKARELVPQLQFYRSGELPIIATSHAYSGVPDPQQDIDLNQVMINDVPWVFPELVATDPVYTALTASTADNFNDFVRFYALGSDAYFLATQLTTLSGDPDRRFAGATGILSIDEQGHIKRNTYWGRFQKGLLKPLSVNQQ